MSFGGSQSSSTAIPGFAKKYAGEFTGIGDQYLNQWNAQGGPNNTNPLTTSATTALQNTVSGANNDPAKNPALQAYEQAVKDQSSSYLDQQLAGINRGANATGNLFNTKNTAVQSEAARESAADVADKLTTANLGEYDTATAQQLQSIQPALQQGNLPYTQAFDLLQAFGGMGTSGSSSTPSLLGYIL